MSSINTKGGEKNEKMIIAAALLPIGLVLGTSLLLIACEPALRACARPSIAMITACNGGIFYGMILL